MTSNFSFDDHDLHDFDDDSLEKDGHGRDEATELIRSKLQNIYSEEPSIKQEFKELRTPHKAYSQHQEFIKELSESGKTLAEIQTEWHNYYVRLPDKEKNAVWSEFYETNGSASDYFQQVSKTIQKTRESQKKIPKHTTSVVVAEHSHAIPRHKDHRPQNTIKKKIVSTATAGGRLSAKHHVHSLLFGLSIGFVAIVVLMFSFFNEIIIAPFIQPSRTISSTPLILNSDSISPSSGPVVIIPKINAQIPVDYAQSSVNEAVIESALNNGVVHYPSTVFPGQLGNTVFFGHSSNNIFNPGKYKFAFVLLHTLSPGDIFYLTYKNKVYAYQVYDKQVVPPTDVAVLNNVPGKPATATLITCDPPGTSINRLVVWGSQVSPDANSNTTGTIVTNNNTNPSNLPGNGPTLWGRFVNWVFH